LKVDNLSIRRICSSREFQVDGAETEKIRVEKLLMMPYGLAIRFVLEGDAVINRQPM